MSAIADMLLQNYLEVLLKGKVAIRLVRALVRHTGKVFTVRKLAQAAGVSSTEAAVAVQELERYGILTIQPVGRSYLIALNSKSYLLNRILKPMIRAEEQTLTELITTLGKHLKDKSVISAALFGSVSRGETRADSDIDLLVITDDFEAASVVVSRASEEVAAVFNGRLSPLILSQRDLKAKARTEFIESVLEDYVHVAGKDLKELIKH